MFKMMKCTRPLIKEFSILKKQQTSCPNVLFITFSASFILNCFKITEIMLSVQKISIENCIRKR